MPDVYAQITEMDAAVVERVAAAMELRAADPQQQAMLRAYLADVPFPPDARVLEAGSGTGAIARVLATWPGVAEVIGVDPSPIIVARAEELGAGIRGLSFQVGDARALTFPDSVFDVVMLHTVLCHVPEPERVIAEALRVLRPGGRVAVFDGDYATTTVALSATDPLQTCIDAFLPAFVNDTWLVRRLPRLVQDAGFDISSIRSHGYLETSTPSYMLSVVDRGADVLLASGQIDGVTADSLKAEARRRVAAGSFFGFIGYASLIGQKPS